ncbi:MAG: hypothetical protein O7F76_11400, partial [Planctomycetota bacterium]|nr:hypothetical protein [Planctomycetota bacterium]
MRMDCLSAGRLLRGASLLGSWTVAVLWAGALPAEPPEESESSKPKLLIVHGGNDASEAARIRHSAARMAESYISRAETQLVPRAAMDRWITEHCPQYSESSLQLRAIRFARGHGADLIAGIEPFGPRLPDYCGLWGINLRTFSQGSIGIQDGPAEMYRAPFSKRYSRYSPPRTEIEPKAPVQQHTEAGRRFLWTFFGAEFSGRTVSLTRGPGMAWLLVGDTVLEI